MMEPGHVLGVYRIVGAAAAGANAVTYRAIDQHAQSEVSLTVLRAIAHTDPRRTSTPELRHEFFRRAVQLWTPLHHPHIIPITAYDDAGPYYTSPWVTERTVHDWLAHGPLAFDLTARILTQIAGALDYAHAQGVIHRNVKASNILLDAERRAYLTGLHIAAAYTPDSAVDLRRPTVGTPAYMSPEHFQTELPFTPAADQYSLGATVYEMVTGRLPFDAGDALDLLMHHVRTTPQHPRHRRPELPKKAGDVILRALEKAPQRRWPTCSAFAEAFAKALR